MLRAVESIGDRLRRARVLKGWNQSELARQVKTQPSVINRFESGHRGRHPEAETIAKYAGAVGVRPEWLLTGEGPMMAGDQTTHESQRQIAARIAIEGGVNEDAVRIVLTHPQAPEPDARPALWWIKWMMSVEAQLAMHALANLNAQRAPPSGPLTPTQPSFTLPMKAPTAPPPSPEPSTRPRASHGAIPRHQVPAELRDTKPSSPEPPSRPRRK